MTTPLRIVADGETASGEIVNYSDNDFENDKAVVRRYGEALHEVSRRQQEIERAATIEMARRLHRLRHDPELRWRGPGVKDTDRAFGEWVEVEFRADDSPLFGGPYATQLLSAAEGLLVLEKSRLEPGFPLPATAGQIQRLSGKKVRALSDAGKVIPNLWMQAVEDAGGKQPKQELVESIVKRYMHDRELVDSGKLNVDIGSDEQTEKVKADLRRIRRTLAKLAELEPLIVAAAVAEFYHDYRNVR